MKRKLSSPKSRTRQKKPTLPRVLEPEIVGPESEEGISAEDLESDSQTVEDEEDQEPDEKDLVPSRPGSGSNQVPDIAEPDYGAISPTDPLRQYIEEAKRYPLLDPEEEFRLAVQLKNTGDLDAAKRLVTANLRLVIKIAYEYRSFYSNLLDLVQEGNIGLMKAVSKFDPTKGARLGYYASWWIRSYILKYILDNFRLVKVGTTQAQKKLFYHLMREKQRLEAQGLLAGPKLLAQKLDVREKDVVEMEQRLSGQGAELPLDAPVREEGGKTTHLDQLADHSESQEDLLARDELIHLLRNKLPAFQKLLNDKELKILKDRLLADEPKTLQEVADLYGLTRERARQIEAKVIQKLRDYLNLDSD